MGLQEELSELRDVLQAVCDYVGHAQVAAALEKNRRAREEAQKAAEEEARKAAANVAVTEEKTTP